MLERGLPANQTHRFARKTASSFIAGKRAPTFEMRSNRRSALSLGRIRTMALAQAQNMLQAETQSSKKRESQ
jgi:hypothetical protein